MADLDKESDDCFGVAISSVFYVRLINISKMSYFNYFLKEIILGLRISDLRFGFRSSFMREEGPIMKYPTTSGTTDDYGY